MEVEPIRICFVCLGNICRSPTAEGVMAALVADVGLTDRIEVHSAGTADWHTGKPPDDRSVAEAARRGLTLTSRASTFMPGDAAFYDLVLAMDRSNLHDLRTISDPVHHPRIRLLRQFDPDVARAPDGRGGSGEDSAFEDRVDLDVADPWHGGPEGFVAVYDMIERSCRTLLTHLRDGGHAP